MILISLLGDDLSILSPVIHEYKDQIKHHILIHDDAPEDKRRALQFTKGLNRYIHSNSLKWANEVIMLDEDNKQDIVSVYNTLKTKFDGTIHLHSTDGFASTALIFSNLVLSDGGKIITYDPNENEMNLLFQTSITKHKLQSRLDIKNYIRMLNFSIVDSTYESDLIHRKDYVMRLFNDYDHFWKLRDALVKKKKNFDYSNYSDLLTILRTIGIVDKEFKLIPSQQQFLQGGLFEEYIFWLIKPLAFDDAALGVKIDFEQSESNVRIYNEFDILITNQNRMYTIECKMVTHLDGLEFTYKYDAIIDIFGVGSKAILLNIAPKEMKSYMDTHISSNFTASIIRRGKMKDIKIYHDNHIDKNHFQTSVRNFFLK